MASPTLIKLGTGERTSPLYNSRPFDLRGITQIAKIFVCHDDSTITSLQFQYVDNNTLVSSNIYGATSGFNFDIVSVNCPAEYITWIGGICSSDEIHSLSIGTTKQTYGPFGGTPSKTAYAIELKKFKYNFGPANHFYGFHGSFSSENLNSIGVYVNPIPTLTQVEPEETH